MYDNSKIKGIFRGKNGIFGIKSAEKAAICPKKA
jgi:hypothetical protein